MQSFLTPGAECEAKSVRNLQNSDNPVKTDFAATGRGYRFSAPHSADETGNTSGL
jgi:hypothetical protein